MNREAFLQQLRALLAGIPAGEANEAIQYYEDYFADAGVENEERVIEELGSPERVAENIRKDLGYQRSVQETAGDPYPDPYPGPYRDNSGDSASQGYYSGQSAGGQYHGSADMYQRDNRESYRQYQGNTGACGYERNGNGSGYGNTVSEPKEKNTVLWVVIAVLTCWLWGPLLIALVSVLFGVTVAVVAVLGALGIAALALLIAAVALIAAFFVKFFISPAGAFVLLGGGLVIGGIGIIMGIFSISFYTMVIPALFKGISGLWRRIFRRGGAAA